ncbi:NAD(P)-dependent dehydrogenase (short-subunit alcohol dehydrogenase family) [Chryseobacterium ginsenosidimutans]|uniref:SDR family NAD(P)-dependent oxidoreductase n=1 Tax=Chryseobacterium ginsenosidimutans TaxID=687846 RepID=UPI0021692444|nr:SDR family oxidoreductase [Chryseobacterium ginsenosidimutans]MCS3868518.1 NAD(P)-dependent dehydrogenase (short-subunit alcohol dehydrogenase family) [Chryseobacterium ginsenosidimutans]
METNNQNQKIAVITGGSRGIGKSIAINTAKRGIAVILTYNNNPEQGNAVAEEINKNGGKAVALKLNVAEVGSFAGFSEEVSKTVKNWGRDSFDYLVNNAGIAQRTLIKDTTEAIFDELVNVNFKGVFFLTQQLVPLMAEGGQIVNISSGLARFAFPTVAVYGAIKAGIDSLTRYFAKEFADKKIRANSVAPGAIDTEFGGGKGDESHRLQIAGMTALGRLGEADDIGLFVASLLSDDSRFVNAQRIEISGGIYI